MTTDLSKILLRLSTELSKVFQPPHDASIEQHHQRGKLLARERIEQLIDPASPFLELSPLAGLGLYDNVRAGAGIVTGIGQIHGTHCVIIANDATVKGGTYFPMTVKKHLRAQEIALQNKLPCIYLVDSGGAFLPMQDEVFPDRDHFGRIFYNQAQMSAQGIPQISVVMGSCTAGGAYIPAMSDESVIVRNQGTIFLGGPPLVKAATGEVVTAEELGGGAVHTETSGVCDYLAENDYDALAIARSIVTHRAQACHGLSLDRIPERQPRFNQSEILELIPEDRKKHFPMRAIIDRIIDGSDLDEFKQRYGTTIICGFARVKGALCGLIANDGILFPESAEKAAHFVQLCDRRRIPLVFFHNIAGFMVGKEYEHRGIARAGAKMVTAVSCATVPKISFVLGGSFGAGNYGMCGRAFAPRFLFMWASALISVMGPEQAAKVLRDVREESAQKKGTPMSEADLQSYQRDIEAQYVAQSDAFYSTARLWDDGVIDPLQTRDVLALALSYCHIPKEAAPFGIFRM
jgi:3-methylcrotonyl-CoA carboxylase beta subunit